MAGGIWYRRGRSFPGKKAGSSGPTDPYWSNVVLLAGNDNAANGTTTFVDQKGISTLTGQAGIAYSSAQAPTGMTTSIFFNGTTQYISGMATSTVNVGTGDFAFECWFRLSDVVNNRIIDNVAGGAGWFTASVDTVMKVDLNTAATSGATTPSINTWYHGAWCRTSGVCEFYLNGTRNANSANVGNCSNTAGPSIGMQPAATWPVKGYLASIRMTKGSNRGYTGASIVVPTLPLPAS